MSIDLVLIFASAFGIGTSVAYAWWAKVRIDVFRQRLFHERDALWLLAFKEGSLEDPAYLQARQHINAMINCGPLLSVFTLRQIVEKDSDKAAYPTSENLQLRKGIRDAYKRSASIGFDYIYLHRISGLAVYLRHFLASLVKLTFVQFQMWARTQRRVWFSPRLEVLSRADQTSRCQVV